MTEIHNIIYFDGVCNLCNSTVDFFYSKNKNRTIFYASLQSEFAKSTLPKELLQNQEFDTIYFYSKGVLYSKSTAVLKAVKELNGGYIFFSYLILVPKFIRDYCYKFISKRRYKLFGKSDTCRIPTEDEKLYFLEERLDLTKYKLY